MCCRSSSSRMKSGSIILRLPRARRPTPPPTLHAPRVARGEVRVWLCSGGRKYGFGRGRSFLTRLHSCHDSSAAIVNIDPLNSDNLVRPPLKTPKSFDLNGIGPKQAGGRGSHCNYAPFRPVASTKPRKNCHGGRVATRHLDRECRRNFVLWCRRLDQGQCGVDCDFTNSTTWQSGGGLKLI